MPQANSISNITPANYQVSFAISSTDPAGTGINAEFIAFAGATPTATITCPPDQVWALTNMYVPTALTIDMLVNFVVGQTAGKLNSPTSTMVRNNNNSPINPFEIHLIIDSGQTFYFTGVTSVVSTSAITEILYLTIIQYPVQIAQQLNAKGIAL